MRKLKIATAAACLALPGALASASDEPAHVVSLPDAIQWGPAPAALPPGAQIAVLHGNPGAEGLFVMRLKMPAGYRIAPHTHPGAELVTVISGTLRLGMGADANAGVDRLPRGAFADLPAGMVHFAGADEETVVQINGMGPFAITYVNPADDPTHAAHGQH
jgi:quercetin dioxygenase-like cupin family protein